MVGGAQSANRSLHSTACSAWRSVSLNARGGVGRGRTPHRWNVQAAPTRIVTIDGAAMNAQGGAGPRHAHMGRQDIHRAHQDVSPSVSSVSRSSSVQTFFWTSMMVRA